MTYLCSPYSHPEAAVREQRFHQICAIAGELMQRGIVVFSPIAHSHPIACQTELPEGWDFWRRFCTEFVCISNAMIVAKMDGWQESVGVQAEIALAEEFCIPIEYLEVGISLNEVVLCS